MSTLRAEIIESQKTRSDLLKWKIILVAGLGAAGLGLSKENIPQAPLLIALMPLVCLYVDILCAHLNLRMETIGEFLSQYKNEASEVSHYEAFSNSAYKLDIYVLENWALKFSTYFICLVSIPIGIISYGNYLGLTLYKLLTTVNAYIFVISSVVAAMFEYVLNNKLATKLTQIKGIKLEKEMSD